MAEMCYFGGRSGASIGLTFLNVSDVVEMGTPDPHPMQPISYSVGPSQLRRMFGVVGLPPALGAAALALALASLILVQSGNEIGYSYVIAHGHQTTLSVYRWSAGIQMGLAAFAVLLAIIGIRLLIGRRPKLTVQPADFDADATALDAMEAATLAQRSVPPAWMATLLGSSLVVSIVALGINAAVFGYTMAAHTPPPYNVNTF
jgi:preprotein translocase subunit SecG